MRSIRGGTTLLLDMGGVTAMDPSDVGELVGSHTTATNRGVRLRLMSLPRSSSAC